MTELKNFKNIPYEVKTSLRLCFIHVIFTADFLVAIIPGLFLTILSAIDCWNKLFINHDHIKLDFNYVARDY